jgi:hypothetical protein
MAPFLSKEEFEQEMIVKIHKWYEKFN